MLLTDLYQLRTALTDLFFPRACAFCGAHDIGSKTDLCLPCLESVREVPESFCLKCGRPFAGTFSGAVCGKCLQFPPKYSKARFAVFYENNVRDAVADFKYHSALHLTKVLSKILIDAFVKHYQNQALDLILPVPVHRNRILKRGYNQSVILARELSLFTRVPLDRTCLIKSKDTVPQAGLSRKDRLKNLVNSFNVCSPDRVRGRRVLLVDDVATTGTTVSEAAKELSAAGCSEIFVLVLALRFGS